MKQILKELLWLLLPLLILIGISSQFGYASLDINLHDTYFVISIKHFLLFLFPAIYFIIYLIKESRYHYQRKAQNLIAIFFGLILIIILSLVNGFIYTFLLNSWTVYPPLSALNPEPVKIINYTSVIGLIISLGIQILIILLLIRLCYKWGKSSKISNE